MFHRDYIMRQILQLVEVFQRIVGLTKGGQFEAALSIIDHELEQLLGLNSGAIAKMGSRSLIAFATFDDRQPVDNAKQAAAAGLLRQAGAIYALQGRDDDSYACYLSALDLLLDARLDAPDLAFPEITPPVEALTADLENYLLPRETNARLMRYYEQVGAYAKAEDVFYEMTQGELDSSDLIDLGISFYRRLQALSDAQLRAGNLPRDEVEAGLAELLASGG